MSKTRLTSRINRKNGRKVFCSNTSLRKQPRYAYFTASLMLAVLIGMSSSLEVIVENRTSPTQPPVFELTKTSKNAQRITQALTCNSVCKTCSGTSSRCTSCNEGYYLRSTSCSKCTGKDCITCIEFAQCSKCRSGYTLDGWSCDNNAGSAFLIAFFGLFFGIFCCAVVFGVIFVFCCNAGRGRTGPSR